jgi:large repetitive protein
MSKIVAQVVEGIVEVKSADGEVKILQQGDILMPGDTLITSEDGSVVLAYLNETTVIAGNQTIVISDSWLQTDVAAEDSVVDLNSAEGILAILNEEGDLLEQLEATAAGGGGSTENSGNSFVRLTRVVELNDATLLAPGTFAATEPLAETPVAAAIAADDAAVVQPAIVQVDNITADDIINAAEAAATIAVTGTASGSIIVAGDLVTLVINGTTYTTIVQTDGSWSVDVAGSDLAADTEFDVVVTSNDGSGNSVNTTSSSSHTVDVVADAGSVSVNNITADDIVNATEAAGTIAVTGSATGGDIAPGDVVTMIINGTTYTTTVQADGTWSVDVAGSDLAADTEFDVTVSSSDAVGNTITSSATSSHTVDLVADAGTVTVNNITADDIVNATEAAGTIAVSGLATGGDIAPGDVVTMIINGTTYTTIVQADGSWSVDVAGADLAADTEFDVTVSSSDATGNIVTSTATSSHTVDITADAGTVTVNNITADDIVNAAEAAGTIAVTGSATGGDIAPGDVVTMIINGTTYTTTVQADGSWSVDVAGSDLAADTEFDVVVSSSDVAGNIVESTGTSTHTVDLVADAGTVTVNNITADDVVNAAEAAGTIAVTGSATGGDIAPGDVVTMIINGTTYTTTVQVDGSWSVDVAGSDLAADTEFTVTVTSSDAAGNTVESTGTSTHTVDLAADAGTVSVNNITADDIVNATEAAGTIAVSGLATGGDIAPGDVVTMIINGTTYTTTVQADGSWTVDVAGSDLAADTEFDVVVSSSDVAGNTVESTTNSTHTVDLAAEAGTVTVNNITADDIVNASEVAGTVSVTGSTNGGDIAPGDVVTMIINGTTYTTIVQADGSWSVDVAGSDLAADTEFDVVVNSSDVAGNTVESTGTSTHTVDLVADAGTVSVNNITADDIVNAAEAAGTIAVTGSANGGDIAPGDVVSMIINGTTYTTIVQADGSWSVDVAGSDLAADTEFDVVVNSSDAAGNTVTSTTTSTHTVDISVDAGTVSVNNITADDIVNAAEAAGTISVTGTANGGDIAPGDVVSMIINGTTYTTIVQADGSWSVDVAGSDLAADTDFDVTVTSSDAAGNTVDTTGSSTHTVDITAQNAPGVTITEDTNNDGFISASELDGAINVTISLADTGALAGDTLTVNGVAIVLTQAQIDADQVLTTVSAPAEGTTLTVNASITDVAGNTGATGSDSAVLDTTAPAAPGVAIIEDTNNDGFISASELDGAINVTISLADTGALAGDTLTVNGVAIVLTQAQIDADQVLTTVTAPAEGATLTVNASITDVAGNTGATGSDSAIIDTTADAGTVKVDNITNDDIVNAAEAAAMITVTGTASGGDIAEGDVVTMVINNVTYTTAVLANGTWSIDVSGADLAADTDFTVTVTSADAAGNTVDSTGTSSHTVDQAIAAPLVQLNTDSGTSATDSITNDGVVNVTLADDVASWQYSVDGGATWLTGTGTSFTLAEGMYADGTVLVQQTDTAGNISDPTALGNVTVDQTVAAPAVQLNTDSGTSATDSITKDGVVNVTLADDVASWQYSVDGGATWLTGTGTSFTLAEGMYANGTVLVQQTDTAGNTSSSTNLGPVTVDQSLPTLTITTDDSTLATGEATTITFNFSEEITGFDLSDIAVTGGVLSGLTQDLTNPNVWTATFVADGTAAISIAVANESYNDVAGNVGASDSTSINSNPVANTSNFTVNEDQVLTASVLTNDVDADGNSLVVESFVINGQSHLAGSEVIIENQGTFQLNANGSFTFTPVANWSGTPPTVGYTISDGQGGTSSATLNIVVAPVADAAMLQVTDATSTQVGATSITTGTNGTLSGSGLSQASLEQALGLAAPEGVLNDPGNINAIDGNYTTSTVTLNNGMSVGFDWQFINGENLVSEIQAGYNDFVLVIITAPDGSKTTQLITSSEFLGAAVNGNGTFNFEATQDGEYKFDWVIINGLDSGKDSQLNISATTITVNDVTYGDMVDLNITAAVVDASESLSITIAGVPTDALLTAGINNADGSWTLTQAELEGLSILTPVGYNGQLNLTVTATTTDGASSTSVSDIITIDLSSTTNTVLSGNDSPQTITGTDAGDLIMAYGGNDVVNSGAGSDVIYGGIGNDTINAGTGNDVLVGGIGNDTLTGGAGADVFAWQLGDQGSSTAAVDVINDFNSAQGDAIDLRDLLQGENSENITDYLSFSVSGGNTTINIKHTGAGNVTQQIILEGVDVSSFGADTQAIIDSLINSGNLKIDG